MSDLPVNRKRTADEVTSASNPSPEHSPKHRHVSPASQETLTQQNAKCRLLSLPPELRNHIYTYIMSGKTISFPDCNVIDPDNTISDPMSAFALTRTCRQIHQETSSLVFTSTTFLLTSFCLGTFAAHVRPERPFLLSQLAQIRTVMVNVPENGRGMSYRLVNQGKALFEGLYPGLRMVVVKGSREELDRFEKYIKVAGYAGWDHWKRCQEGEGVRFVKRVVGEDGRSFEQ